MKVLIIEDEQHSADLISGLVRDHFPDITIVGHAYGVKDGIEMIRSGNPDILFLDIEIQGGTGFDILESINTESTKVIFCTGYDEYAIKAFKYNALDYILKPVSRTEIINAVTRAGRIHNQELALKSLKETPQHKEPTNLIISERNKYIRLPLQDIVKARAEGAYTRFTMHNGDEHLTSRSLGHYEEILPAESFVRVHHSAVINISFIRDFDFSLGLVTLNNESIQEVSVRKRKMLRDLLGNHNNQA